VHAQALRLPIIGDPLYHPQALLPQSVPSAARAAVASLGRQMLHARLLGFTHPTTGERLVFEAPLPEDFQGLLALL
jgi:23S rRNA pseudouridine1911/1915/1917 synthase